MSYPNMLAPSLIQPDLTTQCWLSMSSLDCLWCLVIPFTPTNINKLSNVTHPILGFMLGLFKKWFHKTFTSHNKKSSFFHNLPSNVLLTTLFSELSDPMCASAPRTECARQSAFLTHGQQDLRASLASEEQMVCGETLSETTSNRHFRLEKQNHGFCAHSNFLILIIAKVGRGQNEDVMTTIVFIFW